MNVALPRRKFRVVNLAASNDLVFEVPGQRRLGILLNVARHDGVAPPADGDVQRWAGPAGIGQARGESDLFDKTFGVEGGRDLARRFTPPSRVAIFLDVRRQWLWRPHVPMLTWATRRIDQIVQKDFRTPIEKGNDNTAPI